MSESLHAAIARHPGDDATAGLSEAGLGPADLDRLRAQHRAYVEALTAAGLEVTVLDALSGYPDAYFVEDVAVVLPEVAVVARPGAPTRRGEASAIEGALGEVRALARIEAPGTLDGGDVLRVGRDLFVGISARTSRDGFDQLAAMVGPHGYRAVPVPVERELHLKSSVGWIGGDAVLIAPWLAGRAEFAGLERIVAPGDEAYACNCLRVNDRVLLPAGFPRVAEMLAARGLRLTLLETGEVRRLDGGLTCMSLRF